MLGEEAMWQQGFPIDIIDDKMVREHGQKTLMNLAGSMVSTPVLLAHMLAAIWAVSWDEEPVSDVGIPHAGPAVGKPIYTRLMDLRLYPPCCESEDEEMLHIEHNNQTMPQSESELHDSDVRCNPMLRNP